MKLPNFYQSEPLNQLRKTIGAELGDFTPVINPNVLSLEEIEQLSRSGIEIPLDQVRTLDDGTLAYKNSRVILYIRDVSHYRNSDIKTINLPRFHVSDCEKLQEMRRNKRYERYVVATREDGSFELNISKGGSKNFDHRIEQLNVCQYCLGKLSWEEFNRSLPQIKRKSIVANFTLNKFFKKYGKSLITNNPKHTADTAPLNTYTSDFRVVADRIKKTRNYCCENTLCKINLVNHQKFLHAHHIDAQKNNNDLNNLKLVCIKCHAEEYNHSHLKNLSDYKTFIKMSENNDFNVSPLS